MPHRTVLSASQRAGFETLPTESSDHAKYCLLSDEDLTLVHQRCRAENCLANMAASLIFPQPLMPLPKLRHRLRA